MNDKAVIKNGLPGIRSSWLAGCVWAASLSVVAGPGPGMLVAQPATATGPPSRETPVLKQAGFPVALLSQARNGTVQAFVEEEHELFIRLAETLQQLEVRPPQARPRPFDLLAALQTPVDYRGRYVQVQGHVRRILPLQVTSAAMRQRIGQEWYYQVDLFVSTDHKQFLLTDSQGQVQIGGTWGITLILFALPEVIRDAEPHERISIPGFYLKNWSHKTIETRAVSDELRRPNPVVFGIAALAEAVDDTAGRQEIDFLIGWFWGVLACFVAALAIWQWRQRRRPRPQPPGPTDLSFLD
jgi:hypothetical protein